MPLTMTPLPDPVGARIEVDADTDLENLSDDDRLLLNRTFAENSVTVMRGVALTPASHLALTEQLGEPEIHPVESIRLPGRPEIIEVVHTPETNVKDGETADPDEVVGELYWHADLIYMQRPARGALLRALEVPAEGGETVFVDTTLAYDALDDATKRYVSGKRATYRHSSDLYAVRDKTVDLEKFDEVQHPLAYRVPGTDKVALCVSPAAVRIEGLAVRESQRVMDELIEHVTDEAFRYVHRWQAGDLVIWNNLRALHSALGHRRRDRRILHRTTLKGEALKPLAV